MNRFRIANHADQQFSTIISGRRVTIRLRFNLTSSRWSFDLSLDDLPVLHGRRVVTGVDLLAPFGLGIGLLFAAALTPGAVPDRAGLAGGTVGLFSATEAEATEARAA
ncbi:phage baseplate plug family protein [Gellertiella hungarica]|uniref:Cyanophage baseplate Pam3 plug gp18 domain-containing protein n=1 Tax=Gellertiella hungarica TaxID=1572859 RepID=A0A7W6J435_9HYPH|nr:hypothetical protein [Gellertiella hungarica]